MRISEPPAVDPVAEEVAVLYRARAVELGRLAVLLVGDWASAEDVVQEAFLALQRRWLREGAPRDPLAYVRTAVLNGCRSVLRHRARRPRLQYEPPVWSAESAVVLREEHREVLVALGRLPCRQREVVVMKFYLDMPEAEIGVVLGVSRGTVSSSASRALKSLADQLGGTG